MSPLTPAAPRELEFTLLMLLLLRMLPALMALLLLPLDPLLPLEPLEPVELTEKQSIALADRGWFMPLPMSLLTPLAMPWLMVGCVPPLTLS